MFDQPPPTSCSASPDRFWSGTFSISQSVALPTPPPSPVATPPPASAPYQFLDQSNPRIECDENGKSYLQLGTFNHHLPVTPVLQPKPTTLTPRRPVFRPAPPPPARPPNPTPPSDQEAREQEATFSQHHHQPDQQEHPYWTNLNSH